jgi:hypothetical protein
MKGIPIMKKRLALLLVMTLAASLSISHASPISGSSVTVSSATPGTTATKLGKAEDAAHSSGDTGVYVLGRRIDTQAASSGTSGDYESLNLNAVGGLYVQTTGNTTGGLSIFRSIDLDESEEEIKGSAGTLYSCEVANDTAATKEYLKIYDNTAAGTTVGTTTPVITIPLSAATQKTITFGGTIGIAFATGITAAVTTGIADNDTGAPAANAVVVNCAYK